MAIEPCTRLTCFAQIGNVRVVVGAIGLAPCKFIAYVGCGRVREIVPEKGHSFSVKSIRDTPFWKVRHRGECGFELTAIAKTPVSRTRTRNNGEWMNKKTENTSETHKHLSVIDTVLVHSSVDHATNGLERRHGEALATPFVELSKGQSRHSGPLERINVEMYVRGFSP